MSEKERNAVENVVRGRQPVLVPLPVSLFFFCFFGICTFLTLDVGQDIEIACSSSTSCEHIFAFCHFDYSDPRYRAGAGYKQAACL